MLRQFAIRPNRENRNALVSSSCGIRTAGPFIRGGKVVLAGQRCTGIRAKDYGLWKRFCPAGDGVALATPLDCKQTSRSCEGVHCARPVYVTRPLDPARHGSTRRRGTRLTCPLPVPAGSCPPGLFSRYDCSVDLKSYFSITASYGRRPPDTDPGLITLRPLSSDCQYRQIPRDLCYQPSSYPSFL